MTLINTYKVITLFMFLITVKSYAQNTTIPDSNFERALIDLGYDTGSVDGLVPTENIENITTLNLSNKNISDLTGIEDFKELTIFSCSSNALINLDLSENVKLTKLICSNNQLINIDIGKNVLLEWLDCSNNMISHIDLRQNVALKTFYCYQNDLLNLNLTENVLLTNLQCYRNELSGLDLSKNTLLSFLFCANNKLTTLDLTNNLFLKNLYCYNNQLTELDLSKNTELIRVDCFRNELVNLDFSQNVLLQDLYCYNNEIVSLDLSNNSALRMFNCSNNKLSSLNLKNGTNTNVDRFFAQNNPDLECVTVDDPDYSTTNWTNVDNQVTFSLNCNPLGVEDFEFNSLSIYPNPFENQLNISIASNATFTVANVNGQILLRGQFETGKNVINANRITKGIYFLIIKTETGKTTSRKVIKY